MIRFFYAFVGNVIVAVINLLSIRSIAMFLDVDEFGLYSYLIAFMAPITIIMSFNSLNIFTTLVNKNYLNDQRLQEYVGFNILMMLVGIPTIVWPLSLWALMPASGFIEILIAYIAIFIFNIMRQISIVTLESRKLTLLNVGAQIILAGVHFGLILFLGDSGILTLEWILILLICEYILLLLFTLLLVSNKIDLRKMLRFKSMLKRYLIKKSLPLLFAASFTISSLLLSRYLSVSYTGLDEQAYFAVAQRLALVVILFSNSISNVFWKFIVEIKTVKGDEVFEELYVNFLLLGGLAITITLIWIEINVELIVSLLFTEKYIAAIPVAQVFLFYSLLQFFVTYVTIMVLNMDKVFALARCNAVAAIVSILVFVLFLFLKRDVFDSYSMAIKYLVNDTILLALLIKASGISLFKNMDLVSIIVVSFCTFLMILADQTFGDSVAGILITLSLLAFGVCFCFRKFYECLVRCDADLVQSITKLKQGRA